MNKETINDRKLNITLTIFSLTVGGSERVMSEMANYWSAKDHRVTIITKYGGDPFYRLHPKVNFVSLDSAKKSQNAFVAVYNNFSTIFKLVRLLKSIKPSVVISFTTSINIQSIFVCKLLRVPIIISERYNPMKFKPKFSWRLLRRVTYPVADFIVTQSEESCDYFKKFCSAKKIFKIYNPLEVQESFLNFGRRDKIIINVGRMIPVKGQDLLIQAFSEVNEPDWRLYLIGDGPKMKDYKEMAIQLGLGARIVFPGSVYPVELYYQKAAIFVLSSIAEGMPNALIEAMGYGLACISTDCETGPSEIIENGKNGVLVPVRNVECMSNAIRYLINSPDKRLEYGKNAREVEKKFNIKTIMQQWESLILQII